LSLSRELERYSELSAEGKTALGRMGRSSDSLEEQTEAAGRTVAATGLEEGRTVAGAAADRHTVADTGPQAGHTEADMGPEVDIRKVVGSQASSRMPWSRRAGGHILAAAGASRRPWDLLLAGPLRLGNPVARNLVVEH